MKKLMKSVVPVSALLLMLAGCAEDEEDVNVDVQEEEPATTDGEDDVNIIEEDGEGESNTETNTETNTELAPSTDSEGSTEDEAEDSVETPDDSTETTPETETEQQ
ncbi:hypothetical protein D1B33_10180 [Lysinibacillus yapensis]|uniref:DNA primase n=1 Tax=Ureibacillus yapensis TaxID=2304605 RepID=A0A396S7U3_9BACL|nr:hypothetical protein [Lysinibacillus yapensis]RHW36750.1 hypothetical protein D1B33_10180 [Lysinibacillus yapensis]